MHFRGPLELASVAVYTPSTKSKRDVPKPHSKRHGHQHLHKKYHEQEAEKRADNVVATIDGKVVSWENNYFGPSTTAPSATGGVHAAAAAVSSAASAVKSAVESIVKPSSTSSASVPAGDFERVAYYNAKDQVADGLVFLGNLGDPAISGTWDT